MSDLQILIPMAGEGKRFIDEGYDLPKPLIPVNGVPMVVSTVRDLPPAYQHIFLVRSSHIQKFSIDKQLLKYFPEAKIVVIDQLTEGQACTVRLGNEFLDPDKPVLVAACDNTHVYNRQRHAEMLSEGADCLIWTYRNDPRVLVKPTAHGWVKHDGNKVTGISCKVPISDTILMDHAISGFFTFGSARLMLQYIDQMVDADIRVNGEFYMDLVPNFLIQDNKNVEIFEVDKYIGWGTPQDYEDYLNWEKFFNRAK